MKKLLVVTLTLMMTWFVVGCARHTAVNSKGQTVTGNKGEAVARLQDSGGVLNEIMNAPDSAIPSEVLQAAKCVAIVPDMVKGGFVLP